mmetsp:Transcript_13110/g.15848  ORF Transcript_13110/g.15848 Transcript_13110/m.15848 type:complete len:192 (+) Transcript_13110:88-663(+)
MAAVARRRSLVQKEQKAKRKSLIENRRGLEVLDRVGDADTSLCRVIVKNISASVAAQDVRALFATAGNIKKVVSSLNGSGSTATYEIDFADGDSARKALYEFDQRTLDGRKMNLSLTAIQGQTKTIPKGKSNRDTNGTGNLHLNSSGAAGGGSTKNQNKSVVVDVGSLIDGGVGGKKTTRKSSTSKKIYTS